MLSLGGEFSVFSVLQDAAFYLLLAFLRALVVTRSFEIAQKYWASTEP